MRSYKANNSRGSRQPFCKVCKDAGMSEKMYTSHYVRDIPGPKGIVVCPTLLKTKCRRCSRTGHTRSRCPLNAPKERRQSRTTRVQAVDTDGFVKVSTKLKAVDPTPVVSALGVDNSFSNLLDSDDDDDDVDSSSSSQQSRTTNDVPSSDKIDFDLREAGLDYTPVSGRLWADESDDED